MVINHHLSLMGLLATISFFAIQSPTLVSAGGSSSRLNQLEKDMIDADNKHYAYLQEYESLENLFKNKTPTRDLIEEAIGMLEKEDRPIKFKKEMIDAERELSDYDEKRPINRNNKQKYDETTFAYHRRCRFPDSCDWKPRLLKMDLGTASYVDKMKFREEQFLGIFKESTKEMQQTMSHKINAISQILNWIEELVESETLEKENKDAESKTLEKEDSESEILEKKDSEAVISETV